MVKTNLFGVDRTSVYYTKQGRLTDYALSCGYIEKKEIGSVNVTLWKEYGTYHIRAHDQEKGRIFWDSTNRLLTARMIYDNAEARCLAKERLIRWIMNTYKA